MKKLHNKLVRDNIPVILEEKGVVYDSYIADTEEYKKRLYDKLEEEMQELFDAKDMQQLKEEIVDVLEVLDAICSANDIEKDEIDIYKEKKKGLRGAFVKRIILKTTQEND